MKKFILRTLKFMAVFIAFFATFHIAIMVSRNRYLHLPSNINKVFLGNSTVEYGVDDARLINAVNFAQNGEPVDIIYAKLKLLHNHNPQIDTVFVELDDITLYNTDLVPVVSNVIYFDAFDYEDWINNFHHYDFNRLTKYFSHSYDIVKIRPLITGIGRKLPLIDLGVGGYVPLHRDKLDEDIRRTSKDSQQGGSRNKYPQVPASNTYYYKKIIDYCKNSGIELIFFNTPRYNLAWGNVAYLEIKRQLFDDIPMFDFTKMEMPDSCFGDILHLNHIGARIFTDSLAAKIHTR